MDTQRTSLKHYQFNASAVGFEVENALVLAKFASLIYENRDNVEVVLKEIWSFDEVKYIEGFSEAEDIQIYLAINKEVILIVFRSTAESKKDLNTSTNFSLADFEGSKAHKGFGHALQIAWQKILEILIVNQKQQQKIWLCGHSLGGVLASMAAHLFTSKNIDIQGLYTFGQPRAGDLTFAQLMNEKLANHYFRIVNEDDYICSLPTEWQGFAHAGKVMVFNEKGEITEVAEPESNFWKDTWSYGSSFYNWGKESLPSHSIDAYIERLALYK